MEKGKYTLGLVPSYLEEMFPDTAETDDLGVGMKWYERHTSKGEVGHSSIFYSLRGG